MGAEGVRAVGVSVEFVCESRMCEKHEVAFGNCENDQNCEKMIFSLIFIGFALIFHRLFENSEIFKISNRFPHANSCGNGRFGITGPENMVGGNFLSVRKFSKLFVMIL